MWRYLGQIEIDSNDNGSNNCNVDNNNNKQQTNK